MVKKVQDLLPLYRKPKKEQHMRRGHGIQNEHRSTWMHLRMSVDVRYHTHTSGQADIQSYVSGDVCKRRHEDKHVYGVRRCTRTIGTSVSWLIRKPREKTLRPDSQQTSAYTTQHKTGTLWIHIPTRSTDTLLGVPGVCTHGETYEGLRL